MRTEGRVATKVGKKSACASAVNNDSISLSALLLPPHLYLLYEAVFVDSYIELSELECFWQHPHPAHPQPPPQLFTTQEALSSTNS